MKQTLSAVATTVLLLFLGQYLMANAQVSTPLDCGTTVNAETSPSVPEVSYDLQVPAGTEISITVTPLGTTLNVYFVLYDAGGNDFLRVNDLGAGGSETTPRPFVLGSSNPRLLVFGTDNRTGTFLGPQTSAREFGAFRVEFTCVDIASPNPTSVEEEQFTGYGFAGVESVDFANGIEIPITTGQPQTIPVGNDVVIYTYEGRSGSAATLNISRISGNISIGVAVINKDTNEIIFIGGMPSSNNLSVELTFPSDGTYAIGIFRLDTPTATGTSGAVQISIQ